MTHPASPDPFLPVSQVLPSYTLTALSPADNRHCLHMHWPLYLLTLFLSCAMTPQLSHHILLLSQSSKENGHQQPGCNICSSSKYWRWHSDVATALEYFVTYSVSWVWESPHNPTCKTLSLTLFSTTIRLPLSLAGKRKHLLREILTQLQSTVSYSFAFLQQDVVSLYTQVANLTETNLSQTKEIQILTTTVQYLLTRVQDKHSSPISNN